MCAAGSPLELLQPETLRWKVMEPVNLLGKEKFSAVDIRLRVKGGGHVSQAYGAAHCTHARPGQPQACKCCPRNGLKLRSEASVCRSCICTIAFAGLAEQIASTGHFQLSVSLSLSPT